MAKKKIMKPRARWVYVLMCSIKWKILVKLTVANKLSDIEELCIILQLYLHNDT